MKGSWQLKSYMAFNLKLRVHCSKGSRSERSIKNWLVQAKLANVCYMLAQYEHVAHVSQLCLLILVRVA